MLSVAITGEAVSAGALTTPQIAGAIFGSLFGKNGIFNSADDGQPGSEPDPSTAQQKKLSKGEIKKPKKAGIDPHDLKDNSRQDFFKDGQGNVFAKPKSGIGPGDPTGVNIDNLDDSSSDSSESSSTGTGEAFDEQ